MGKKKNFARDYTGEGIDSAPGGVTTDKIPLSINGGKTSINDFLNVPIGQLTPYQNKQGSDFSRKDKAFFQELVNSIQESGIIDPLVVRPIGLNQYEILAGETRWLAAQEVGLKVVPCHIMDNVDDAAAQRIFAVTNLLRRTLLPSDLVNGWWHYHQSLKKEGRLKELRQGISDPEISAIVGSPVKIQYRQIMNYVAMHSLIPEWLDRLDEGLGVRAGCDIAKLDEEKQRQLLPYAVTDEDSHLLVEIAEGRNDNYTWSEELLSKILTPLSALSSTKNNRDTANSNEGDGPVAVVAGEVGETPPVEEGDALSLQVTPPSDEVSGGEEAADQTDLALVPGPEAEEAPAGEESIDTEQYQQEKQFRKAKTSIIKGARSILRPNDYGNAESIIVKALTLYYTMLDKGEQI